MFAPGEPDPEEGHHVEDCCAGLLGAVFVLLMAQRGHPPQLEIAASTLLRSIHAYMAQTQHLNHEPPTAWNTLSSNEL